MAKYRNALIIVLIALIVLLGGWVVYRNQRLASASYSVVYLTSGDIYIGHLSKFPTLTLTDGYFFRTVPNSDPKNAPNFELTPMKDFVWAPKVLKFNPEQVLLTAPLSEEARVVKAIREAPQK